MKTLGLILMVTGTGVSVLSAVKRWPVIVERLALYCGGVGVFLFVWSMCEHTSS